MNQNKKMNPLWLVLGLSGVFFVLFLVVSAALFMKQGEQDWGENQMTFFEEKKEVVGVIELNGVILSSKKILKKLKDFEENKKVKAVVMRLNSPGGAVAPSQEIYSAVKNYSKPIVSSMASVAASGAYYIASGTQKIIANPGTITGSIGVIMEFANLSKLYEWAKIKRYAISTGPFKGSGAEYKPMSPEARKLFQEMIDDVHIQFKSAVAEGRKLKMSQVNLLADGRVFSGNQAKQVGLVDVLGGLREATLEAAKLAGIEGEPKVVYPKKKPRDWMSLLDFDPEADEESRVSGILNKVGLSGIKEFVGIRAPGIYWIWPGTAN
ncbi:MAG: signal peptide peptidase SppA [Bdellovibrionaceae bacterium]|nr:signal peptide peptidase SppA [Pseudobdellovibrionaceae bacterium]|tara:strand:+ start:6593 stop:7561 length:969 start_codon:yes stop_codon:yes gene_type:complete